MGSQNLQTLLHYCIGHNLRPQGRQIPPWYSDASDKLGLSARAYTRIMKIARTIADLKAVDSITALHVSPKPSSTGAWTGRCFDPY